MGAGNNIYHGDTKSIEFHGVFPLCFFVNSVSLWFKKRTQRLCLASTRTQTRNATKHTQRSSIETLHPHWEARSGCSATRNLCALCENLRALCVNLSENLNSSLLPCFFKRDVLLLVHKPECLWTLLGDLRGGFIDTLHGVIKCFGKLEEHMCYLKLK